MSTQPSSTAEFETPDSFTTPPALRWLAWALVLMLAISIASSIGYAILAERHRAPEFLPGLTRVDLPAGQCFAPQPGDVLHITVTTLDLTRQDIQVTCLNAGPRPTWSGL